MTVCKQWCEKPTLSPAQIYALPTSTTTSGWKSSKAQTKAEEAKAYLAGFFLQNQSSQPAETGKFANPILICSCKFYLCHSLLVKAVVRSSLSLLQETLETRVKFYFLVILTLFYLANSPLPPWLLRVFARRSFLLSRRAWLASFSLGQFP